MTKKKKKKKDAEYVGIQDAAEILGLHHTTVRKAVVKGEIPAVRIGERWRIPREALHPKVRPLVADVYEGTDDNDDF